MITNFRIIIISLSYKFSSGQEGEKEEKRKVQKIEYIENEKNFFGKVIRIFHNFYMLSFGEVYRNRRQKL